MDLEGEKKMTIRYANGKKIEAVLLSRTEKAMRVALQGSDDVVVLNDVNGSWVTDDGEPVAVTFAWEKAAPAPICEEDFICSPDLAARLIDMLNNCEPETQAKALAMAIPAAQVI
jgi:hypothetical protein